MDKTSQKTSQGSGSSHVESNIQITQGTISLVFAVAAFMMGMWALSEAQKAGRETRVFQQLLMDHDALLIREGLKQPGDESKGPAANLDYKPRSK